MDKKVINLKVSVGGGPSGNSWRTRWESRAVTREELAKLLVTIAKSDSDEMHYCGFDRVYGHHGMAYFKGRTYCWTYNGKQ